MNSILQIQNLSENYSIHIPMKFTVILYMNSYRKWIIVIHLQNHMYNELICTFIYIMNSYNHFTWIHVRRALFLGALHHTITVHTPDGRPSKPTQKLLKLTPLQVPVTVCFTCGQGHTHCYCSSHMALTPICWVFSGALPQVQSACSNHPATWAAPLLALVKL